MNWQLTFIPVAIITKKPKVFRVPVWWLWKNLMGWFRMIWKVWSSCRESDGKQPIVYWEKSMESPPWSSIPTWSGLWIFSGWQQQKMPKDWIGINGYFWKERLGPFDPYGHWSWQSSLHCQKTPMPPMWPERSMSFQSPLNAGIRCYIRYKECWWEYSSF